jgi:REP-associated tyrosine transposase
MYVYRQLTPDERDEVLRRRRERGFPLHAPPHPIRGAGRYLISAANFEHNHIMSSSERRTDFESRLLEKLREIETEVFGWVVLSNHYHVLLGLETLGPPSAALKDLHGSTAREWNVADRKEGARRVWYHYNDRKIRGEKHFYRTLNYVHYNAVKHGYVKSPYDWPWSSVHSYLEAQGRDWLRNQWQKFRPDYIGRGWDD